MKDIVLYLFGLPGIFVILFLLASFYLFTSRFGRARTFSVILLVTVLLFSNVFVGKFLASFLVLDVKFKTVSSLEEIDMVVMPTQGINYNGSAIGWTPSIDSFRSANIAYFLQAKLADRKVPVLMCGGKIEGNDTEQTESEVVKAYFDNQTTQIRKTLTETISKNPYEQAWQCSSIMKRYNVKNPALVVDEIKMLRTLALFRSRGVEMIPFPVFAIQKERSSVSQFLPSIEGLMLNRSVFKEYIELALDLINQRIEVRYLSYKPKELENKE